jgi:hypothetical protein
MAVLARVTLPDVDGVAADEAVNSFAFAGAAVVADVAAALISFYNDANTTHPLSAYLGSSRSRVANMPLIQIYDITAFLHGEPHGTPIFAESFTLVAPTGTDEPDQVAAVLSYHADVTALPEHGALVSRPTPEEAQDEGAPATFMAKSRPRASLRGRIYFGPLTSAAVSPLGEQAGIFTVDAITALHRLRLAVAGSWGVWSRTYGTISNVTGGWVDDNLGVQRRRKDKATARTAWV